MGAVSSANRFCGSMTSIGFTETDIDDLSKEIGEKLSETEFKDRMDDVHEKISSK